MKRLAAAAWLLVACNAGARQQPIASCDDDLHGVWQTPGGRWMLIDNGTTLEAYPLFDDSITGGAPRVIDLARTDKLGGQLKRRYMQREKSCDARAPFNVTQCKGKTLQVVRGEVAPPLTFSPCAWGQAVPTHVETWQRE